MVDLSFFSKNKGSFIVAGAFFMMIFLMIGTFAIDLSRYYMKQQKTQEIAEGAALTAANEFNQARTLNNIDRKRIVNTTMEYIKQHSPDTDVAGSYDTSTYEVSPEMTTGKYDIQYDSFGRSANTSENVPNSFAFTQSGGQLRTMKGDEAPVKDRVSAGNLALGPSRVDFNGNGVNDIALLKNSTTIKLWDPEAGEHTTISLTADQARTSKSLIGVGEFNGQTGIYYAGNNEEDVYRVSPSSGPTEVVDNPDGDGTNSVAGIGDVDGDGQNELVFADASQQVKVAEPGGAVTETGITAGSNNNIGIGQPADFDGDGTASIPIVHGGNEIQLLGPGGVRQTILDGAVANREAEKSPISAVDVDGDQSTEIVYQRKDNDDLRYVDDVTGSNTPTYINDASGSRVPADSERGVVGAGSGLSDPFYRIGVQVMTAWEPLFLPKDIFGDEYFLINANAVARAEPQYQYTTQPGTSVQRRWDRGMATREEKIQLNNLEGDWDINSGLCSRGGQVKIQPNDNNFESMEINGEVRAEGGQVEFKNAQHGNKFEVQGDITSGNGDIKMQNMPADKDWSGDWYANNGSIDNSAGVNHVSGSESSDGTQLSAGQKKCASPSPMPVPRPSESNLEDEYGLSGVDCSDANECTCDPNATFVKCNNTNQVRMNLGNDVNLDDQMLYIDGNTDFQEASPNKLHSLDASGNSYLFSEGQIHARNMDANDISGEVNLIAKTGQIHFNNYDSNLNLEGNLISDQGQIHFNNMSGPVDIDGSMYSNEGQIKLNNIESDFDFESEEICTANGTLICSMTSSGGNKRKFPRTWRTYLIN